MHDPQTIREALLSATKKLSSKDIPTARLDAEVLLAFALDIERSDLYMDDSRQLSYEEALKYEEFIERRAGYEPVAYIRNKKEFFSIEFFVNEGVMIPRPETELLVLKAIDLIKERNDPDMKVVDIGTGSGAIPVSILSQVSQLSFIYASDISDGALEVAKKNVTLHNFGSKLRFLRSDLFSNLEGKFDLIISNPPYIKKNDIEGLAEDVMLYEPRLALDGGLDGLEIIGQLIKNGIDFLLPDGVMLIEIGADQSNDIIKLEHINNYKHIEFIKDYSGRERILFLKG